MGYSTTFRLKGELDSRFIPNTKIKNTENMLDKAKSILIATCMDPFRFLESPKFSRKYNVVYDSVFTSLFTYIEMIATNWKIDLSERLKEGNNEIDIYGWQYSEGRTASWEDRNALINYFTRELFFIAIEQVEGRFSKNNDDYYAKLESLQEEVDDMEYNVQSAMFNEFTTFYREHPELADESDGYSHKFPEEELNPEVEEQKENIKKEN